jgi:transposase-like protein
MDTSKAYNAKFNSGRQEMNRVKLVERFGSEDRCRSYLEALRWPEGVRCINCGADSISRITTRNQLDCNRCRTRFSVTSGTVFHDSHLPLWKWFLAIYMMGEARKGVSANQLKRTLGVSYKTAWYLCHRIRWAMGLDESDALLGAGGGTVEADDTYVGGKVRRGLEGTASDGRRRALDNKTVVLGAIERGGKLRVRVAPDAKDDTIHGFLADTVADDADAIYTVTHKCYIGIADDDTRYESVNHGPEEWVRGDVHTNSIESAWSLFDRAVIGSYHKLSKKHMDAYLSEFEWRFNNRENPFLFRDALLAMVRHERLTYETLTQQDRS